MKKTYVPGYYCQDTDVSKEEVSVCGCYYQNMNVCKEAISVGFEVPTVVVMKSSVF
jgi:hypothetical protein